MIPHLQMRKQAKGGKHGAQRHTAGERGARTSRWRKPTDALGLEREKEKMRQGQGDRFREHVPGTLGSILPPGSVGSGPKGLAGGDRVPLVLSGSLITL